MEEELSAVTTDVRRVKRVGNCQNFLTDKPPKTSDG